MTKNIFEISLNNDYVGNTALVASMIKKYCGKEIYPPLKNTGIDITTDSGIYKIIRLDDDQFYALYKNSISIIDDYFHLMSLARYDDLIYSSFSKMYVTLKSLFGEHGDYFDDWKGSFSFPFLIYFKIGKEEVGYLMNIYNIKSSIEFKIYKLIQMDDESVNRDIIHNPFDEFPREEINHLIDYLVGFLSGYFDSFVIDRYDEFFYKSVISNLILFGYKDGRYFDDAYESEKEFYKALQELKQTAQDKK